MWCDGMKLSLQAVHLAKLVEYWDEGIGNEWEQDGIEESVSKGSILHRGREEGQGRGMLCEPPDLDRDVTMMNKHTAKPDGVIYTGTLINIPKSKAE